MTVRADVAIRTETRHETSPGGNTPIFKWRRHLLKGIV
jgi:hypothetical protein